MLLPEFITVKCSTIPLHAENSREGETLVYYNIPMKTHDNMEEIAFKCHAEAIRCFRGSSTNLIYVL